MVPHSDLIRKRQIESFNEWFTLSAGLFWLQLFVQLLIPLNHLAMRIVNRPQTARQWTLSLGWLFAIGLLSPLVPYELPAISTGWLALLAYPRLSGD